MQFLSNKFLNNYPDEPETMNELAKFVFYRTYSRWLANQQRRETFKEAIARAVNYNINLEYEELSNKDIEPNYYTIQEEAEMLFDNIFNLKQFLSGRTHWVGGADTGVASKFPLANFNCSFLEVTSWDDISEMFYLLLVGTGVGFRCSKEDAKNLPPIRTDYELTHSEYKPLVKEERLENTETKILENGYAKIYVGDSKEGWVGALSTFLSLLTNQWYSHIKHIKISYNSIRPQGEKLETFGGTASGHESLKDMFDGINDLFKDKMDTSIAPIEDGQVRPIHILDIGNLIGNNVVVGGVRRTAEIFLCDVDDWEVILAKYGINGIWDEDKHNHNMKQIYELLKEDYYGQHLWKNLMHLERNSFEARPLHHRHLSNNSILFESKPSTEYLSTIFDLIQIEGEPGFINLESAQKRRKNAKGVNPCGEVLLNSYGVCNLTTVNIMNFVEEKENGYFLNIKDLLKAQALSARAGLRMTCLDLELKHWDNVHKTDRLVATSLTGFKDAVSILDLNTNDERELLEILNRVADNEAIVYAKKLRIPTPLLVTSVKPEGTLSQVANGVSSGLHASYSPYYIRRIRISENDPLLKIAEELNWTINPEVGSSMQNAKTFVIDFPVASGAQKTRDEYTAKEQLATYFRFQEFYTDHNSSNTIHVRPHEWDEVQQIIENNWDKFIGVTFMPYDGGNYRLAPYEEITADEYHELKESMGSFSYDLITKYEESKTEHDIDNMDNCEGGACPIF